MVNVFGTPGQVLVEGVTVITAVTGALPVFTAVNAGILPVPFAGNPIEGLLFVQAYVEILLSVPVNDTALVVDLLHNAWSDGCATDGIGFTVIVNDFDGPLHPNAFGVTEIVATDVDEPLLTAVNGAIFPVPLAGKPMEMAVFVQLYIVPLTAPANIIALVAAPLHIPWLGG